MLNPAFAAALFAASLSEPPVRESKQGNPLAPDILIILGVALVLGIIAVLWALYRAKKKRHSRKPRTDFDVVEVEPADSSGRRKIKYRRKDHRPINPTLSQTGGLPPRRGDASSESRS